MLYGSYSRLRRNQRPPRCWRQMQPRLKLSRTPKHWNDPLQYRKKRARNVYSGQPTHRYWLFHQSSKPNHNNSWNTHFPSKPSIQTMHIPRINSRHWSLSVEAGFETGATPGVFLGGVQARHRYTSVCLSGLGHGRLDHRSRRLQRG